MSDIVERLKQYRKDRDYQPPIVIEAAQAIATLTDENERLREGFIAARAQIKLYRDLNNAPCGDPELNDIMEAVEASLKGQQ